MRSINLAPITPRDFAYGVPDLAPVPVPALPPRLPPFSHRRTARNPNPITPSTMAHGATKMPSQIAASATKRSRPVCAFTAESTAPLGDQGVGVSVGVGVYVGVGVGVFVGVGGGVGVGCGSSRLTTIVEYAARPAR